MGGMGAENQVIRPNYNTATKGLVVKGATVINAIGRFE